MNMGSNHENWDIILQFCFKMKVVEVLQISHSKISK